MVGAINVQPGATNSFSTFQANAVAAKSTPVDVSLRAITWFAVF
jgi:hypothetical protein